MWNREVRQSWGLTGSQVYHLVIWGQIVWQTRISYTSNNVNFKSRNKRTSDNKATTKAKSSNSFTLLHALFQDVYASELREGKKEKSFGNKKAWNFLHFEASPTTKSASQSNQLYPEDALNIKCVEENNKKRREYQLCDTVAYLFPNHLPSYPFHEFFKSKRRNEAKYSHLSLHRRPNKSQNSSFTIYIWDNEWVCRTCNHFAMRSIVSRDKFFVILKNLSLKWTES